MWIELNGERKDISSENLQNLCEELEFDPKVVATAKNGNFIPRDERIGTRLNEGDRIEVFAPRQGG